MKYEYFKHSMNVEGKLLDAYGIILFVNGNESLRVYDVSTDINIIQNLIDDLNKTKINPFELGKFIECFMNTESFM